MRAEKDVRMLQSFARSTAKATGPIVIKHSSCNMGMMPVYSDFEYLKGQGHELAVKIITSFWTYLLTGLIKCYWICRKIFFKNTTTDLMTTWPTGQPMQALRAKRACTWAYNDLFGLSPHRVEGISTDLRKYFPQRKSRPFMGIHVKKMGYYCECSEQTERWARAYTKVSGHISSLDWRNVTEFVVKCRNL